MYINNKLHLLYLHVEGFGFKLHLSSLSFPTIFSTRRPIFGPVNAQMICTAGNDPCPGLWPVWTDFKRGLLNIATHEI